jgi:hypothetical protein
MSGRERFLTVPKTETHLVGGFHRGSAGFNVSPQTTNKIKILTPRQLVRICRIFKTDKTPPFT